MKNKTKIWWIIFLLLIVGLIFLAVRSKKGTGAIYSNLDEFAKCLSDKGVAMYGAYWCPHCLAQKAAFGSSFQFVKYVECTEDVKKCTDAGVTGYPTWVFPDGRKLTGEQSLETLSSETSCPLVKK